jgi:hypothetical protein
MDPRGLWREKGVVSSGENDGVLLSQTLVVSWRRARVSWNSSDFFPFWHDLACQLQGQMWISRRKKGVMNDECGINEELGRVVFRVSHGHAPGKEAQPVTTRPRPSAYAREFRNVGCV